MAELKYIDSSNVTNKLCQEFIYGVLNGFCSDGLFLRALPGNYKLGESFYSNFPNVKPQQMKLFKRMQKYMAHEILTMVLGGSVVLNNAYDENDNILSISMWSLPESSPLRTKLSTVQRIWLWAKSVYWRVTDSIPFYLAGHRPVSLISDTNVNKWIDNALKQSGTWPSNEKIEELAEKPDASLEAEVYPLTHMYFLEKLCVTVQARRQGLGMKMLKYAEDNFPAAPATFQSANGHSSTGPTKLSLLSSPAGAQLYEKAGYTLRFANVADENDDEYGVRLYDKVICNQ